MEFVNNAYVRVIVEFVHDIAAGVFPGAVWFAWMIRDRMEVAAPEALPSLGRASSSLWLILIAALLAIAITGGFRLAYWRLNVQEDALEYKRRLIWMKHTAFVITMLVSIFAAAKLIP